MRIPPKPLDQGRTLHFEESVGGGVLVSVVTHGDGKAEINVHDEQGSVAPCAGGHLEDCISRAERLVGFFRKALARGVQGPVLAARNAALDEVIGAVSVLEAKDGIVVKSNVLEILSGLKLSNM